MPLSEPHRTQPAEARERLENPRLAARLIDLAGRPVELALDRLPTRLQERIHSVAQACVWKASLESIKAAREADRTTSV